MLLAHTDISVPVQMKRNDGLVSCCDVVIQSSE